MYLSFSHPPSPLTLLRLMATSPVRWHLRVSVVFPLAIAAVTACCVGAVPSVFLTTFMMALVLHPATWSPHTTPRPKALKRAHVRATILSGSEGFSPKTTTAPWAPSAA